MWYNACTLNCEYRTKGDGIVKRKINLSLIREQRLKLGFSNEDMANSLGLASPDKYFRRKHGTYKFQAAELPALSKKLNIPLEKIFI